MIVNDNTMKVASEVLRIFHENPKAHEQSSWVTPHGDIKVVSQAVVSADPNICNTSVCVAGGVQWVTNGRQGLAKFHDNTHHQAIEEAGNLLGLTSQERYTLFYDTTDKEALEMLKAIAAGDVKRFASMRDELIHG